MPVGIVVPVDENEPLTMIELADYTDYQRIVGGTFEVVDLDQPRASLYVNEEGKLINLPQNRRATLLMWVHHPALYMRDVVLGPAIITGEPDDEGETQDVPAELMTLLMKSNLFRYEVKTLEHEDKWYRNNTRFDNWADTYNAALSLMQSWALVVAVRVLPA